MTRSIPPISVRLDPVLAATLERHCVVTGQKRSRVVQEALAVYLAARKAPSLGDLAEAILPPLAAPPGRPATDPPRNRFRQRVREKPDR